MIFLRLLLFFTATAFAWSCASPDSKSLIGYVELDTTVVNFGLPVRVTAIADTDTTALLQFRVNDKSFMIDTLDAPGAIGYSEMLDFDRDGSSDILFNYLGNNPTYFLYLYDSAHQTFREIEGYMSFPDSQPIEGNSNLYYSYHRAGCSDMNWESDLLEIRDFQITHLANLYGEGCEPEKQQISIYRVINNDSDSVTLVETLPFSTKQNGDKWDIIDAYWNKNYAKFL